MTEPNTKKTTYNDNSQLPLLSLKQKDQAHKPDHDDHEEQEALWNRSLEFFHNMNTVPTSNR